MGINLVAEQQDLLYFPKTNQKKEKIKKKNQPSTENHVLFCFGFFLGGWGFGATAGSAQW